MKIKLNLILTLLFLMNLPVAFPQTNKAKATYLAENAATWNGSGFENIGRVFTPAVLKNQLVLIGESHGIQYSYDIQFDLIKSLREKTGFRHLFIEMGYLDGIILNDYLKTGEDSLLNNLFKPYNGTFYYNKSTYAFYKKLYQFNKTLQASQKIILVSIDIEHGYRRAIKYLQQKILTGDLTSTNVAGELKNINADSEQGKVLALQILKIYPEFEADKDVYKKALGRNFNDIEYLFRNTRDFFLTALSESPTGRDSVMAINFNLLKQRYNIKKEKLVGIFGSSHVKQAAKTGNRSFTWLLKKAANINGVASIVFCYSGGYVMMPKGRGDTSKTSNLYKMMANNFQTSVQALEDSYLLKPYTTDNKGVLFNLSAPGTPFTSGQSLLNGEDNFINTTELFQILVLVNNSPATEPFTGSMDRDAKDL